MSGATRDGVSGSAGFSSMTSVRTYAVPSSAAATELLSILRYRISPEYTAAMLLDVDAAVIANRPLSHDYHVLALAAPAVAAHAAPGQFVMLKPGGGFDPLLRRPFSVFEILRDADGSPPGITI